MQCASNPNAGLYQGKFHSNLSDEEFEGFAVIAPNDEIAAISFTAMVGIGGIVVSGKNFSGGDTAECEYEGELTVPDVQFNLLQVTIEMAECGDYNGTYKGYGAQMDYYSIHALMSHLRARDLIEAYHCGLPWVVHSGVGPFEDRLRRQYIKKTSQ